MINTVEIRAETKRGISVHFRSILNECIYMLVYNLTYVLTYWDKCGNELLWPSSFPPLFPPSQVIIIVVLVHFLVC